LDLIYLAGIGQQDWREGHQPVQHLVAAIHGAGAGQISSDREDRAFFVAERYMCI
jgi:hypothetical protein